MAEKKPLLIVALGDSTTAGTPYFRSPLEAPPDGEGDPEVPWPAHLEALRPGWKVANRGVNGQRTDQIAARLRQDVVAAKPRYAVILAGVNDVYQGVPPETIRRNLIRMYLETKAAGIVPVAASVLPFTNASAEQSRGIRELNDFIEKTARDLGFPFCDTHKAAADPKNPHRLRGSDDGLHPDPPTYKLVADALAATIDALERKSSKPAKKRPG